MVLYVLFWLTAIRLVVGVLQVVAADKKPVERVGTLLELALETWILFELWLMLGQVCR